MKSLSLCMNRAQNVGETFASFLLKPRIGPGIPSMKSRSIITRTGIADRPDLGEGASVGLALAHDSAARHVRGTAAYVDDLPEPAGTVHIAPGCAASARGAIRSIELDAVRASPGVVAVLTAADIPAANDCSPAFGDDPILAAGEILFHGQVVFAVVAETRDAARRAARHARIEVEAVAPRVTVDDGLGAGAEVLAPYEFRRGEPAPAIASAPHRLEGRVRIGGQEHFYLEGQAALAVPGEDDEMWVLSSDPASFRGPEPRRPHARRARRGGGVRVPADGRGVRRQGVAGGAVGLPRGARRARDRPARQGSPRPRRRHGDDRKASRLPRGLALRLRRRGHARGRRRGVQCPLRVLGGPLPRRGGSGHVPRRQRLLLPGRPDSLPAGAHRHGVEHRVSGGSGVRRGCCSPSG